MPWKDPDPNPFDEDYRRYKEEDTRLQNQVKGI
jgi:hypothetical protein